MITLFIIVGLLCLILGISAGTAWLFMTCWNYVAPLFPMWHLPHLEFWAAWAILIVIGLLTSGFRTAVSSGK